MTLPLRPLIRATKSTRPAKSSSVNELLRAAYGKFTRDKHTKRAVNLVLK